MNRAKQFLTIGVLSSLLFFGLTGCGTTAEERIETLQTIISTATTQVDAISADLNDFQSVIKESKQTLSQSELDEAMRDRIESVLARTLTEFGKAQVKKDQIIAQIKEWEQQISSAQSGKAITTGGEMQLYGQGARTLSVALPSPWNTVANIIGGLLITGGGVAARRLQKKAAEAEQGRDTSQRVAKDIVDSVDVLLGVIETGAVPKSKDDATGLLKSAQADETREVVRSIKKKTSTVAV